MTLQTATRLPVVNGLRGLAVIGVIAHHSFFDDFRYGVDAAGETFPLALLMSSGWLGVNLFFFLSGLVLYLPYAAGDRSLGTRSDIVDFYARRARRLVPLYTLMWILSLVFMSGLQLDGKRIYVAALAYASFLFPFHPETFFPPGNWVMWSIGVEVWFSVLLPVLALALSRYGWHRLLPAVLVGALAVRVVGKLFVGAPDAPLNFVSDSVLGRMDEFVLGMLAAHLYCTRQVLTGRWFCAGALLVLAAMLMWAGWYHHVMPPVVTALAVNLLDVGFLLCALHLLLSRSRIGDLLRNGWLQLLGMMCYSIYLWHGIVQLRFKASFHHGVLEYVAYLAVILALSFLTYRYVEFGSVRSWRELVPALRTRT
jgi:peptidoglycan/LPS O-acetylase OafA/YrhL